MTMPDRIDFTSPGLHITAGQLIFEQEARAQEHLRAGLKLAVLLKGGFDLGVAGDAPLAMQGSSATLFVGRDPWQLDHRFASGACLQFLTMHLGADLLADEFDLDTMPKAAPITMYSADTPSAMSAITQQILCSPYSGLAARLHLAGKGLELAALALDRFMGGPTAAPLATPAEILRLQDLHAWLASHYRDTPPLDQLARLAGLNIRKLTTGFRRLYGQSVAEYLRDIRLNEGHRLLSSGCSATQAAEQVGYTLPHFTSAFRRRFGVTPGTLTGRDTARNRKI